MNEKTKVKKYVNECALSSGFGWKGIKMEAPTFTFEGTTYHAGLSTGGKYIVSYNDAQWAVRNRGSARTKIPLAWFSIDENNNITCKRP
jgi:hypothetical protein